VWSIKSTYVYYRNDVLRGPRLQRLARRRVCEEQLGPRERDEHPRAPPEEHRALSIEPRAPRVAVRCLPRQTKLVKHSGQTYTLTCTGGTSQTQYLSHDQEGRPVRLEHSRTRRVARRYLRLGFWGLGLGLGVWGVGLRVPGFWLRVSGFEFRHSREIRMQIAPREEGRRLGRGLMTQQYAYLSLSLEELVTCCLSPLSLWVRVGDFDLLHAREIPMHIAPREERRRPPQLVQQEEVRDPAQHHVPDFGFQFLFCF